MTQLFALFEHAAGYALFRVQQFEEIGALLPEVEKSVHDLSKFQSVVNLTGFYPFKNAANALDNINSISEGVLHDDLKLFLEANLPVPGKKQTVILGVGDSKIGAAITEALGSRCQHTGVIPELLRGIRAHFPNLVKGLTAVSSSKAQLGLGHSYSRAKVKFNVNRVDNMIIQSIALLDQLDKDINTFSMRIREWYSYHFPELVKIVGDNYTFAKVANFIGNRKELTEEHAAELEELVMDSAKVQAIIDAARSSMGMDISPIDLTNIQMFAVRVISLSEYRRSLQEYLRGRMNSVAPNLATLIGEVVGARLISHAGSLTSLAKYPASTVQILGAEKALFRALKTKGNTPKYGLIFHSTFIGRAGSKNKGRISRYLANKCSIASRIDCFSEIPTTVFGEKLRGQVEDRLKYYETGDIPRKNLDVMKDAILEASVIQQKVRKKKKKQEKKEKKAKDTLKDTEEVLPVEEGKKKKKKKASQAVAEEEEEEDEEVTMPQVFASGNKKRKRDQDENAVEATPVSSAKKTKKNKRKQSFSNGDI